MSRLWMLLPVALAAALPALAQDKPSFAKACGGKPSAKILSAQTILVICGKRWDPAKDGAVSQDVKLYETPKEAAADPAVPNKLVCAARLNPETGGGSFRTLWKAELPAGCSLTGGSSYALALSWTPPAGSALPVKVSFDSDGSATVTDAAASIDSGMTLTLDTNSVVSVKNPGFKLSVLIDGVWKEITGAAVETRNQALIRTGHVDISIPFDQGLAPGKYQVKVENLVGALGEDIEVDNTDKLEVSATRGTAKDDVLFYSKFGHQAGEGSKPAWSVEVKSEVELAKRLKHWRMFPMISVDTGFGSADTNDSLKAGFGIRRFFVTNSSPLQGYTPVLSAVYETDRLGGKRNLVADADLRLFFKGLYNPLAKQNRIALEAKRRATGNYKLTLDDLTPAERKHVGYTVQAFLGAETGGSLYKQEIEFDQTVNGAKQKSKLDLPQYGIFRARPKVAASLELYKLTLSASGTARYLANTEPTGRQLADKTYVLANRRGWIGYGEFSVAWQFNSFFAVDSTYKVGAVPPLFKRVNIVQSGIVYHF